VTAGGTEEPIDGVRRLTNTSTGATGCVIAEYFAEQGAEVVLLHAERATPRDAPVEREPFVTFDDLEVALSRRLREERWDAVIHLAAVSDYSLASLEVDGHPVAVDGRGKIGTGREVVIRLEANPKLIDSLRKWSCNGDVWIIGFKLTHDPDPESRDRQVRSLLERGTVDLVVHNDVSGISAERHDAVIWDHGGPIARTHTKRELAEALYNHVSNGVFA
jgi:phosphopantothenoylcysteine decarboxylase/phosphopantothenate--cysteine ligase